MSSHLPPNYTPYKQYMIVMKWVKGEYLHMLTNAIQSATDPVSVSVLVTSVRSMTIFKYNFRWLHWYSKTRTSQSLWIIVLSTEQKNQGKVNCNIKPYNGWTLSAVHLQEFLIRHTRSCADKRVVLDVGVMKTRQNMCAVPTLVGAVSSVLRILACRQTWRGKDAHFCNF